MIHEIICFSDYTLHLLLLLGFILQCCIIVGSENTINIAFARGGAHLPIAHAFRLLFLGEIEIEKK